MSTPTVSCILAVYNGRQYLAEAIGSLCVQSRPVDEIIVVDDGSTDDTAQIAEQFGPPVRCVRQKNAGQSAARNHGVRVSCGEMLSFLDCDDLVHPDKIGRQLQRFAEAPQLTLIDAYAQNFWSTEVPEDQRQLAGWQTLTHSNEPWPEFIATWLFRREVWQRVGEFDENRRFAEDSDWHDRARFSGMPMETMRAVLARRRLHPNNLTRNNYDEHIDGLQRFYKEKIHRLRVRGTSDGPSFPSPGTPRIE
jgi:glycosyltransferase involved in cell wall biosynthesis